jgi:hypothetical protein
VLVNYFGHDAREDNGSWIATVEFIVMPDDEISTEVFCVDLTDLARFITNQMERSGQHG